METQKTAARQEFLTREEAAKFSHYSVPGFLKIERAGKGPPRVRVSKKPLYHIDDLRAWLLSRTERPKLKGTAALVESLGRTMRDGLIPQLGGTCKQASLEQRLDAAIRLLKLLAPDVA